MSATIWELSGKVKSSKYRHKVIIAISQNILTPTEIKEETSLSMPHTSRALRELSDLGLIECKNPKSKKGKLYAITKLGQQAIGKLTKEKHKN